MISYSSNYHDVIQSLSPRESPLTLIEFSHPLSESVRLVNDAEDLVSNGKKYIACSMAVSWPDDQDNNQPRATFGIDNIGNMFSRMLEDTVGLYGAKVTISKVLRSAPNVVEGIVMGLSISSVSLTMESLNFQLSQDDTLNIVAVPETYRHETTPGLF
jgi:hypothetical protein